MCHETERLSPRADRGDGRGVGFLFSSFRSSFPAGVSFFDSQFSDALMALAECEELEPVHGRLSPCFLFFLLVALFLSAFRLSRTVFLAGPHGGPGGWMHGWEGPDIPRLPCMYDALGEALD